MAKIIELSFSYMKKHSKTDASQFFQFQTETEMETETETFQGLYIMNDPLRLAGPPSRGEVGGSILSNAPNCMTDS